MDVINYGKYLAEGICKMTQRTARTIYLKLFLVNFNNSGFYH